MRLRREAAHPAFALAIEPVPHRGRLLSLYATARCSCSPSRPSCCPCQVHADDLRHARLLHGHAVDHVRLLHRPLRVRDHDELRLLRHPAISLASRPTFVSSSGASTSSSTQNGAGWNWKIPISSDNAVSAFSPPESSSMFCSFLPGGGATISMPLIGHVLLVASAA